MPLIDPQPLVDGATKSRRRTTAGLIAANIAVAALLALIVWLVLQRSRQAFEAQAKSVADALAAVAQLNIQSDIDRVDAVIRATTSELEYLLAAPGGVADDTLNEVLRSRHDLLADVEAVRLTDAQGLVRWGTDLPPGAPTNVADREYFDEASRQVQARTLIAGPLTSRVSGHWVIAFMRPLHVHGRFAGVVYASIDAEHFRRMFERYDLEPLDAVTMRRDDRRLVARYAPGSSSQGQVGDSSVSASFVDALAKNSQGGSFVSLVTTDGELRTTSYRALDTWPFVVYAGISHQRFFALWRQQGATLVSLAALVWLLVALATWLVHRVHQREEGTMQALADQGKRIQALLRTAGDGIHITDVSGHLVEMSDSFAEMLKSSREQLLGRHISSWDARQDEAAVTAWMAKVKPGDRQRVDVQHRRDDGQLIDVEMQLNAAEIGGRLLVFSSARDVTTERRLAREQAAMLDSDLVGMVKIEGRYIVWRNRAVERMLGYGPGELQGQPARLVYWDEAQYRQVGVEGYEALRDRGYYRSQIRMRRKSGESVWIDFAAVPFSDKQFFAMLVDITAMKLAHEELAHAAFHDPLTQLPNRLLLFDRITQAQAMARREHKSVAICYLDLDGFKAVNDQCGHEAGDQLLKTIAGRLLEGIRPCDCAARLGGDEFVLVLAALDGDDWKLVLDRVIQAIALPVALASGALVTVGATAGVALFHPDEVADPQELIERADHRMLVGKRQGKGHVVLQ